MSEPQIAPNGNQSWQDKWEGHVPTVTFEEYSAKYKDLFVMKRVDGIIELRLHTNGGPYIHNWGAHNAMNRVWQDVGNDPENEVLILTATGDRWFSGSPEKVWAKPLNEEDPDYIYQQMYDGIKLIENLVTAFEIPTIAVVNGPGIHTEIALLCDITMAAEDADFMDPHFFAGSPPGDGLGLILQAVMGPKRGAFALLTGQSIPAAKALELGLINEVLPREQLLKRAWELAGMIMKRPRFVRRMSHAITVRPWKKLVSEDLGFHMAHNISGLVGSKQQIPMPSLIQDAAKKKVW